MTPNPYAYGKELGPRRFECDWCKSREGYPCTVENGPRKFTRRREVTWYHQNRLDKWAEYQRGKRNDN